MSCLKIRIVALASFVVLTCGTKSVLATEIKSDAVEAEVVATVNKVSISQDEFDVLAKSRSRHPMGQEVLGDTLTSAQRQKLIDDLILAEVLAQEASKRGVDKLPQMVAEAAIQYKTLLGQVFLRQEVARMQVSEEEIRQRYEAIPAKNKYSIRAIDLNTQKEIEQALAELNEGEDFQALANSYTPEGKEQNGGWLGWLRTSQMDAQQVEIVQRLEVGYFSASPIKTRAGWRLLYLDAKEELDKPPFNRARDWIRNEIQQKRVQALLAELRQNADIEILQP